MYVDADHLGFGRLRRHPWRTLFWAAFLGFVGLNVLAYLHAGAMLHYAPGGVRPPSPESLTWQQKIRVLLCGVSPPRPENRRAPSVVGLPSESIVFHNAQGVRLEGWLIRSANPLGTAILFPGYSAARDSLLDQAREFHRLGYVVMAIDFQGCGGLDGSTTTLGYREADDVAAAVNEARRCELPRPLVLYGQSMGAAAVLRSLARPDVQVDAVILEAPFARLLDAVRNRFDVMRVPSFPAAELLVFWGGVRTGIAGFAHNPVDDAPHCTAPTLVLHGDADRMATPAEGRAVCEAVAGPHQFAIFVGAGHASLFTADPERWRDAVAKFLKSLNAANTDGEVAP